MIEIDIIVTHPIILVRAERRGEGGPRPGARRPAVEVGVVGPVHHLGAAHRQVGAGLVARAPARPAAHAARRHAVRRNSRAGRGPRAEEQVRLLLVTQTTVKSVHCSYEP